MEEQILKIINNSFEYCTLPGINENDLDEGFTFNMNKAAKEIADHMEKFIKWFADNVQTDRNITPFYFIYESTGVKGQFSIAELFNHWNEHFNNEKP